jgi:alpha-1,2-rhamnosyltransferase
MRLLIECTFVFEHPWMHTGIQRVVRNVLGHLPADPEIECIPIILRGNALRQVIDIPPTTGERRWLSRLNTLCHRISGIPNRVLDRLERMPVLRDASSARRWMPRLRRIAQACARLPLRLFPAFTTRFIDGNHSKPLAPRTGDVLVLLDSSWNAANFALVEQCKRQGMQIVAVVYDLIPLTHPQFCDAHLARVFQEWFAWLSRQADGFMCISQFVRDEARRELAQRAPGYRPWLSHFYLGADLDRSDAADEARPQIRRMCAERPVYLMVSTIEPRKNHAYLLDAFDLLWARGVDVSLCFIGRVGWKCERTMKRAKNHAERDRRLFLFHDADDSELEYCYRHARSLVFPSFVEGFGLPLVEAMERGLPVMASDIPVFHEICEGFAAYFDLNDPASLAKLVSDYTRSGTFPAAMPIEAWDWPQWPALTAQFVHRIVSETRAASTDTSRGTPRPAAP